MKSLVLKFIEFRITRFLISGGFATATNLSVLFILVHFFGVWYLLASVFSFISAVYIGFTMQKFFTFNDYFKINVKEQILAYLGVQVANLGINTFLMYVGVSILGIHYLVSQMIIGAIISIYSFFVYKNLIFSKLSLRKTNINNNDLIS